jgi:hypothetical protein
LPSNLLLFANQDLEPGIYHKISNIDIAGGISSGTQLVPTAYRGVTESVSAAHRRIPSLSLSELRPCLGNLYFLDAIVKLSIPIVSAPSNASVLIADFSHVTQVRPPCPHAVDLSAAFALKKTVDLPIHDLNIHK